jgi:PAS domain S-box-containing protein
VAGFLRLTRAVTSEPPDFRQLFDAIPGRYLIVATDAPRFTIVTASDGYLSATRTERNGPNGIAGRGLFDVLPDDSGDPDTAGAHHLRTSLQNVISNAAPDASNTPVVDRTTGVVTHIIHQVADVAENGRVAAILESISDAVFTLDEAWCFTYVNHQAETILFRSRNELLGRNIWEAFPEAVGSAFEEHYRRAVRERTTARFESFYPPLDTWFEVRAYPAAQGLTVYFQNIDERKRQERVAQFSAAIGRAVTQGAALPVIMQRCCEAAVDLLHAAFARVWVLDSETQVLNLVASAGLYTHLNGPHSRVPVGTLKIGRIAAERTAHLSNSVIGDVRVSDQAWAAREGMVAFAGYPLVVHDQVVGVMAMFSRTAMSDLEFDTLRTAADAVSVCVANARTLAAEQVARKEAVEANRAKSEFLAMMSHELRTPLNAIGGYVDLLELGVRGPVTAPQHEDLARVKRSQRHLLSLIGGVLDYANVDAGAMTYRVEPVRVDEVLEVCRSLTAPQFESRQMEFRYTNWENQLVARADRGKVQQVIVNLLSNAVKFTDPGGEVRLECAREGSNVVVRVCDTGSGIPVDQLSRIFQPFVQVDSRLTRMKEGTGLGLAISRRLARGMGGDLTVSSTLGEGSTFTLLLPAADQAVQSL